MMTNIEKMIIKGIFFVLINSNAGMTNTRNKMIRRKTIENPRLSKIPLLKIICKGYAFD